MAKTFKEYMTVEEEVGDTANIQVKVSPEFKAKILEKMKRAKPKKHTWKQIVMAGLNMYMEEK